jgi:hypothetical protein
VGESAQTEEFFGSDSQPTQARQGLTDGIPDLPLF